MNLPCPDAAEYEQFLEEALPPLRQNELATHLESCSACQQYLQERTKPTDRRLVSVLSPLDPTLSRLAVLSQTPKTLPAGRVAARRPITGPPGYKMLEELGRGGMGVVYKARHKRLGRLVALKMILAAGHASPVHVLRFLREAELIAKLQHPNIVQIYEVGQHDDQPFLALEYVEGGTLADQLESAGVPWSPRAAAAFVEQLARAVQYAHQQGIVHRDLKPSNILLSGEWGVGSGENPKASPLPTPHSPLPTPRISDFGLAKELDTADGWTPSYTAIGTPQYMAPEQARGDTRMAGPAADIYALGAILYELLTGRPPFLGHEPIEIVLKVVNEEAEPISRLRPGLPLDLATICMKCLEKEPGKRYSSADALAEDLRRFRERRPILARPVSEWVRAWLWSRRRPAVAGLLVAVAVALAAGTGFSLHFGYQAQQRAKEAWAAQAEASQAKLDSDHQLAERTFQVGLAEMESGLVDKGMFTVLKALELAPGDAGELRRVLRTNLAAWAPRLPVLSAVYPGKSVGQFLNADGKTFAFWPKKGNVLKTCETKTGKLLDPAAGRPFPGAIVSLSRDGQFVVVLEPKEHRNLLQLYEVATGRHCGGGIEFPDPYSQVEIAPDNQILAVHTYYFPAAGDREETVFYRASTGQRLGQPLDGDYWLTRNDAGRPVALNLPHLEARGGRDVTARAFDLETGKLLTDFRPAPGEYHPTVVFDGRAIVAVSPDGAVHWWEPVTLKPLRQPWHPPQHRPRDSTHLTADGRTAVVFCTDHRMRWYDLATGQEHPISLTLDTEPEARFATHPDGRAVLLWTDRDDLRLWHFTQLPLVRSTVSRTGLPFYEATVSPDQRQVLLGHTGPGFVPQMYLTDAHTGEPLATFRELDRSPVFSPDGRLCAAYAAQIDALRPEARVWDTGTGLPRTPPLPAPTFIHSIAFSPDGKTLAVGCIGATLLWDIGSAELRHTLRQDAPVASLAFSPDGTRLATGSRTGWSQSQAQFRLWDLPSGKQIGDTMPVSDTPRFAFDADRQTLHTLELVGGRLRHWDLGSGQRRGADISLQAGQGIALAAFREDGSRLFTGYISGEVRVWDTATGQSTGSVMAHRARITALAISSDGRTLAVGCEDGSLRMWDVRTTRPVSPVLVHTAPIRTLVFRHDARRLFVLPQDGALQTWPVPETVPDDLDVAMLERWLMATIGARIDAGGSADLTADQWQACRRSLVSAWPIAAEHLTQPRDGVAWNDTATAAAISAGHWHAALWHLDQQIASQPPSWIALARRGRIAAAAGRLQTAAKDYESATALGAGQRLAPEYRYLAADSLASGRPDLERWYLDRLLACSPNDWQAYADRAALAERLGDRTARLGDLQRAVELGAERPYVLLLAEELGRAGHWREVIRLLERAETQRRPDLSLWYPHALACLKSGDSMGYRHICAHALAAPEPTMHMELANGLAMLCALGPDAVTDWTRPLALIEQALAIVARVPAEAGQRDQLEHDFRNTYGAVLYRCGRTQEAIEQLERAVALKKGRGQCQDWLFLALAHRRLGNSAQSSACLKRAREVKSTSGDGWSWEQAEIGLLLDEAAGR